MDDCGTRGVPLATMVGDSIYVGLVMAVFLTLWTVTTFFAGWRNHTSLLVLAGFVTAILALPYGRKPHRPGRRRSVPDLHRPGFPRGPSVWFADGVPQTLGDLPATVGLLPLNYLLELIFLIAGILYLIRLWYKRFCTQPCCCRDDGFVSVLICTFLKSGLKSAVITNNDLGWRGISPCAIHAADMGRGSVPILGEKRMSASRPYTVLASVLPLLLMIGIVSTAYSAVTLRVSEILNDRNVEHAIGKKTSRPARFTNSSAKFCL